VKTVTLKREGKLASYHPEKDAIPAGKVHARNQAFPSQMFVLYNEISQSWERSIPLSGKLLLPGTTGSYHQIRISIRSAGRVSQPAASMAQSTLQRRPASACHSRMNSAGIQLWILDMTRPRPITGPGSGSVPSWDRTIEHTTELPQLLLTPTHASMPLRSAHVSTPLYSAPASTPLRSALRAGKTSPQSVDEACGMHRTANKY
jgi:hypothetical protein